MPGWITVESYWDAIPGFDLDKATKQALNSIPVQSIQPSGEPEQFEVRRRRFDRAYRLFWWVHKGDPEFRPNAYPDLHATLDSLHQDHVHAMLSIWPLFDSGSRNYLEMRSKGLTI